MKLLLIIIIYFTCLYLKYFSYALIILGKLTLILNHALLKQQIGMYVCMRVQRLLQNLVNW